ncbi:uncharacterized protein BJ212DRAFT_1485467 [Suillus subaureus]|uniref:Uncharacterized protein n=1 Tax=Suillus subaureus TaxID=48587 RepID=A0A9P7J7W0_9AGAM|nr:uncharacterized protein BJ212DRAFT_1485467 [Suillus subaureus]KAG1807620.1 hypothetical protein BJ212DRAFT_1485467 [Suillus subaureus]
MVEKSNDSHVDGPVLKPICSFNYVVRMRADTPQPGAEAVSAGTLGTEDTPSNYKTLVAPNLASSATKILDNPFISSKEGPSNPKGKEVDPCNWGNANLYESEIDLEAQREALANWAQTHEWSRRVPEQENREDLINSIMAVVKATES